MIRRLIILLLIVGCVFGEDEYPYFSDAKKQLEFEKKKIYIEKVDNFEMKVGANIITEIELLKMIGLIEEAEKLETDFNSNIEEWENNKYFIEKKPNIIINWIGHSSIVFGGSIVVAGVYGGLTFDPQGALIVMRYGTTIFVAGLGIKELAKMFPTEIKHTKDLNYIPKYTDNQLISLAESYNRKIYKEIKD